MLHAVVQKCFQQRHDVLSQPQLHIYNTAMNLSPSAAEHVQ